MTYYDRRKREVTRLYRAAAKRGVKRSTLYAILSTANDIPIRSSNQLTTEMISRLRKSLCRIPIEKEITTVEKTISTVKKRKKRITTYIPVGVDAYKKGGKK